MTAVELGAMLVRALGWSLVHFIWQAALIGMLYVAARTVLPRGNPRYLAAMLALIALAVVPLGTVWHELQLPVQPAAIGNLVMTPAGGVSTAAADTGAAGSWLLLAQAMLPWLVLVWACGVALLGVRVVRQWRGLRAIVRAAEALPAWQERARQFGRRIGLRRTVRVLASVRIATPTLVGWVRPVVVLPLAVLAQMPAAQVDLILAHELAHLRRLDHIANLFQVVLETLLFYHPVVHWISRDARNERELCCDALALQVSGGSRRDFVAALAGLEEFRCDHRDLALAASGGVLVERAWFIAGVPPKRRHSQLGVAVALIALLGAASIAVVTWRQDLEQQRIATVLADNAAALRHGSFATVAPAPVALQNAISPRPQLAPLALVPATPAATEAVPRVAMPVANMSVDMRANMPANMPVASRPVANRPLLAVLDLPAPAIQVAPVAVSVPAAVPTPLPASAPRPLRAVAPTYPPQALLNGVQGRVEIEFSLSAAGVPQDLRILGSSASGLFDAAALQALSRWRFAAPSAPGRIYRQAFTFQLDGTVAGDATAAQACLVRTGTHICRPVLDAASGALPHAN